MLKKLYYCIILISILLVLPGCKDFFTFNLFEGLDYVAVPTAEKLNEKPPAESVAYLKEQFSSDSFIDTIENDTEAVTEISQYLEDVYTDTAGTIDTPTQVSAAVLAADLQLAVTGGDELIDNVWNALTEIQELQTGENTNTNGEALFTILGGIVPPAIEDQTSFTELVTGILTAGEIYQTLGDTILTAPVADNSNGDITGGVVFNAAVTGIITTIVTTLLEPAYQEPAAAAGVLWALYELRDDPEPDPNLIAGINPAANMDNILTNLTYLENIAAAVNLDLSTLFTPPVDPPVVP